MPLLSLTLSGANGKPHDWTHVSTPFGEVQTLLNTTGLDSSNIQENGLLPSNIRTNANIDAVRIKVRNATGGSLTAGTLVYFSGTYSDGTTNYPTVAKAISHATAGSNYFSQGILVATTANGADGTAAVFYELSGVNTSSTAVGDLVYLDTTAGGWTKVRPTGGQYIQVVGTVTVVHASTGRIAFSFGSVPEFLTGGTSGLGATVQTLTVQSASGAAADVYHIADAGEDNADKWKISVADGGVRTWESYTSGSYVAKMALDTSGNVSVTGELDAVTLDISGDADIDGTLEADAITLNGTALGALYSPIAGGSGIVTTGALNSGSITSGFGTIDTGSSTITTTGVVTAGSLDISGDADIDGTLEADAITLGGTALGSLYSPIAGGSGITTTGTVTSGTWSGVIDGSATMTLGSDATGDVYYRDASGFLEKLAASTDGHVLTTGGAGTIPAWEAIPTSTADITSVVAGAGMTGGATSGDATLNVIGGNGITANADDVAITAAQTTVTSVINAALALGRDADNQIKFGTDDQIVFEVAGGDGVTFKASGEIEATSLDISGDADIDGTLEAAAITLGGTALGSLYSPIAGGSGIVTTGALNSGSITSGFGTIDTGSSTITTTGVITAGGFTIGSAAILEAELEILDGATLSTAELNILDGVTSTAAELNILDGVTSTAAEINLVDGGTARGTDAVASGDGLLVNDAGTMRMTNVDTVSTYFSSHNVGGGNIVTTGALNSGSITSGFGTIDTGSSTITTTGVITSGGFTIGSAAIIEAELEIIDGATLTTTELNLIDGDTARGTDAVGTGDGLLVNDGGTMKMTNVDTVSTYFSSHSVGGSNIVTTGTVTSGTWSGVIDGSATITMGSDATGDMYYRAASTGYLTRLAAGADGYVLTGTGAGSIPAWEAVSAGVSLSGTTDGTIATVTGANALEGEAGLTFNGSTLAVTGASTISTTLLVGATGSPDGTLNVVESSSGATAQASNNTLVLEAATNVGMSLLCNDGAIGRISFGDATTATMGQIGYNHGTDAMFFNTNNTQHMVIDSAGAVTMPTQPAFFAGTTNEIADVTGDATAYIIVFPTEQFDSGGDYNTSDGLFTAPVAGRYQFNVSVWVGGLTSSHTAAELWLTTSDMPQIQFFYGNPYPINISGTNTGVMTGSCIIDMDAADTAKIVLTVAGGAKVVDVQGSGNATYSRAHFSGFLAT